MLRDLKYFWLISRPLNVGIAFLAFAVACYIAFYKSGMGFLGDVQFYATAMTISLIAATGYWINDVYDFRIDRINKPDKAIVNAFLSVKKVLTFYFIVTFLILSFSLIYFAWYHKAYQITFVNFLSVFLLFVYASYLKRISVVGNLVIAFLVALVIILAGYLYHINSELMYTIAFAFQITLLREITKDIEDIRGDLQFNLQTLPIQIGIRATKRVLWGLYIFFLISCYLPFIIHYFQKGSLLWTYLILSIILVQLPTLYILTILRKSFRPSDFTIQSRYLKYLIVTGIVTILFLR